MEHKRLFSPSWSGLCFALATYSFLYIPILVLIIFSFSSGRFPAPWSGFTWQWYQELWASTHIWAALYNSLLVATCATILSVTMGILLIYYCMRYASAQRFIAGFYTNLVIPEVVLAVGLLSFFTFFSVPLGLRTLIIAHTVLGVGYVVPILFIRYQSLDEGLIESSLDLGATTTQTFVKIVLPLLRPAILTAALLTFIISFDDFVLSYFCAGNSAQTLSLYILAMLRSGISPVVNALSTLLLVISSVLVLIFCSLSVRIRIF